MRIVLAWLLLELRRRWRSLVVLALLIAVSAGTVLTAVAGARRGASALDRLLDVTLPATAAVLPNQPGFDWAAVRELPQVAALATFPVTGFDVEGIPPENFASDLPSGDPEMGSSVERPVVLEGRLADPTRPDEAVVTPAFVDSYGKGVGDTVTVRLLTPETADLARRDDPLAVQPDGPVIPTRIVGVVRSYWFSDKVGDQGRFIPSTALFHQYRANLLGSTESVYINALVRLHGGAADLPAFRADLARLTGRTNIEFFEQTAFARKDRQVNALESACLLAFGLAALLAAIVLVEQAIARYTAATVADLQVLRPTGMTPRQVVLAACAAPALVGLLGTGLGVGAAVLASRWMPFGAQRCWNPSRAWTPTGWCWVLAGRFSR
ncbi:MAG: ABC transporter permease [Pseudonocardiales bacterium]